MHANLTSSLTDTISNPKKIKFRYSEARGLWNGYWHHASFYNFLSVTYSWEAARTAAIYIARPGKKTQIGRYLLTPVSPKSVINIRRLISHVPLESLCPKSDIAL
jgi:hypothetical protein